MSADNEPARRRADVAERITRHQSQRGLVGWIQDPCVVWVHHLRVLDTVDIRSLSRDKAHEIVRADFAEAPEERIAMRRQPDVARFARQRRAADVADRQAECARIAARADDCGYVQPRDLEAAERGPICRPRSWWRWTSDRSYRCRWRWRRCENGVELPCLEGLIQRRLGGDVAEVPETEEPDDQQQPFEHTQTASRRWTRVRWQRSALVNR